MSASIHQTAMQRALAIYREAGRCMEADIAEYMVRGFVDINPDRVLIYRPMVRADPDRWPEPGEADTWFIRLAVGDHCMRKWFESMPWFLPNLAWYRRFKKPGSALHVYDTIRWKQHIWSK